MTLSNKMLKFIVELGGIGRLPKAPGTFASFFTLLILAPSKYFLMKWNVIPVVPFCLTLWIISAIIACLLISKYETQFKTHDSSEIVVDEWVGQSFPLVFFSTDIITCILMFIFFRLFDVWKIGPVYWADQHLKGGFGTLLDDIFAGMMATIATGWAIWFFGFFNLTL